jgi:choline-sulfatase
MHQGHSPRRPQRAAGATVRNTERRIALSMLRLALVANLGWLAACGARESAPPLVVISIDTLRADRLGAYGYRNARTPHIDALASEAVLFENAYTHYPLTLPAHLSAFTGRYPPNHGVRDNVGYTLDATAHPPIQELLRRQGYTTGGFVSAFVLRRETGFAAGFETFDEPPPPSTGAPMDAAQRAASATLAPALAWLEKVRAESPERPPFLFFHLYEPHAPYTPPEPYASRHQDPYDAEVEVADAAVGELIAALRRLDLYDRAAIVVMSDHGEGLGDHGEQQHGVFLYRSTMQVALLAKLPGKQRAGERIAAPVGLVDLAPTLAGLAGIAMPAGIDGQDLLAAPPPADRSLYAETYYPRVHFGWSDLQAMIEARWYLVRGPQPELFDLAEDPRQESNVLLDHRREYARLNRLAETIDLPLAEPQGVDEETARRLASLGYLTTGRSTADIDLPDPKTQRHLLAEIEAGMTAFWTQRDAEAAAHFSNVLAENPDMADIWGYLARAHDRLGDKRAALRAWERVLELSGGMGTVAMTVAERYLELGDLEHARKIAESVETLAPAAATELLVQVDLGAGRLAEARQRMEAAVESGVASELLRRRLALAVLAGGDATRALAILEPLGEPEAATRIVRSLALADLGRGPDGLAELERAKAGSERPSEFFENLGVALLELGRLEQARAAYEEIVKADPRAASAWNTLGVIQARMGNPRGAVAAWRQAIEANPQLAQAWSNLAVVATEQGDRELARWAWRQYLTHAPASMVAERARAEQALRALGAG